MFFLFVPMITGASYSQKPFTISLPVKAMASTPFIITHTDTDLARMRQPINAATFFSLCQRPISVTLPISFQMFSMRRLPFAHLSGSILAVCVTPLLHLDKAQIVISPIVGAS
jgi:ABC-type uncharacterized transport system permease subunit